MIKQALNYASCAILICLALTQIVWCIWVMETGYDDLPPSDQAQAAALFSQDWLTVFLPSHLAKIPEHLLRQKRTARPDAIAI